MSIIVIAALICGVAGVAYALVTSTWVKSQDAGNEKMVSISDAVAEGADIETVKIPPRSPDLNPVVERSLGSVRRERLDHVVILHEEHLRRVLQEYSSSYFNAARPHQGLEQKIPVQNQAKQNEADGKVVAIPVLGGLHHDYRRAA